MEKTDCDKHTSLLWVVWQWPAIVAQLVEQTAHDPKVKGLNPPLLASEENAGKKKEKKV